MQDATDALLLATHDTSLSCYLALQAPWKEAYAALVRRIAALKAEADAIGALTRVARVLQDETTAWTAVFEALPAKVDKLKSAHASLSKARKEFHQAQANVNSDDESDSCPEADSPAMDSDAVLVARRACRHSAIDRDLAASDLLTSALAYYPELLVKQRRRLMPSGVPALSQRLRCDCDNIQPLARAGACRYILLRATFDGIDYVLKQVPVVDGDCLSVKPTS